VNHDDSQIEFDETPEELNQENTRLKKLLNMSVNDIELSVRATNCLNSANITTVGQLALKTEAEMLKYRNFGKKSSNEIKDKLLQLGLSLGIKFESGLVEPPMGSALCCQSDSKHLRQSRSVGLLMVLEPVNRSCQRPLQSTSHCSCLLLHLRRLSSTTFPFVADDAGF
jgi:hypothetical protein